HRQIYAASDRHRQLIANAWDRIGDDAMHCIAKADLRGNHEGGERLADSIDRLMRTIVRVRVEQDGRPAVMKITLLSRTTEHDDAAGLLYYRFDAELRRIIQDSRVFARLRKEVMFAFTSKYALALYEMGEKRRNLQFCWTEIFELTELRELLGVSSGELTTFGNAWCLKPAAQEVNGLADFGIAFCSVKTGRKVAAVQLAWWRKSEDELKAAFAEVRRHRTGRRARLEGTVESISATLPGV
ncbi:MAG: replication initiation protein, partial [Pseudomonadota bacterium]|nr:replication initiation protein [Pseudomonadota bacterium]